MIVYSNLFFFLMKYIKTFFCKKKCLDNSTKVIFSDNTITQYYFLKSIFNLEYVYIDVLRNTHKGKTTLFKGYENSKHKQYSIFQLYHINKLKHKQSTLKL